MAAMNILAVMPLALVMIAGPQILSSFFFALAESWRRTSACYVLGAAVSISIIVTLAYLLGLGASDSASSDTIYYIVLALLLFGMLHTFQARKTAEPPAWMGKLQTATPRFAFRLGFLLLGVFPSDLITSVSVGGYLAAKDDPLYYAIGFLGLTLLLLALPALAVLIMGRRAEAALPKIRDWMTDNSWIVNELVLLLFVGIVISSIAD
jgi:Sap, sulfolipid-1-addressing protein